MNTVLYVSRIFVYRGLSASSILSFRRLVNVNGLGNKIYGNYNEATNSPNKRLNRIGMCNIDIGYNFTKIEAVFLTWKDKDRSIWLKCRSYITEEKQLVHQLKQVAYASEKFQYTNNTFPNDITNKNAPLDFQGLHHDDKNPFLAKIKVTKELHKGGDRSCLHVELDISNSNMQYEAGDHIAIYPINDTHFVERLGKLTASNLDEILSVINTDEENSNRDPLPCPTSYRTALTHYVEITALPDIQVLRKFVEYCSDEDDKQKLLLMTTNSQKGKELYQSFVVEASRNIVHVLEDIISCKPPLDLVCHLMPRLQPRYYSISSSPKLYPEAVHVTAVVVKYKTSTGRTNKGVTTSWLAKHKPEQGKALPRVPVYIKKSEFRLPLQSQTPVVMVSSGTGLAPFRGFLQERAHARRNGQKVGDTILYFGCRHSKQDYIYQEELEQYAKDGDVKLQLAFSRDQAHKVYVTHLLEQNMDQLWDIIGKRNGHFYICGDARNIAVDVRKIVLKTIQQKGRRSEADAEQFIRKMVSTNKYLADVWS